MGFNLANLKPLPNFLVWTAAVMVIVGSYPVAASSYSADDYQAQVRDSDKAISHYARGIALFDQGDRSGAIEFFNQALQLNPDYLSAYFYRGKCCSSVIDS